MPVYTQGSEDGKLLYIVLIRDSRERVIGMLFRSFFQGHQESKNQADHADFGRRP